MVKIKNLTWSYKDFKPENLHTLLGIYAARMKALNITTQIELDSANRGLIFKDVDDGQTFKTAVDNKIFMKEGDKRIKEVGRDYLISKRPTKEQYDGFFNTINQTLDQLGLFGEVELVTKISTYVLRKGKETFDAYPKLKSYPLKMDETKGAST